MMQSITWLRIAAGCPMVSVAVSAARAEEIVVGQVAPLSGVLAETGKEMVLGAKVYFYHVNANGGIHGKRIRHDQGRRLQGGRNRSADQRSH